MIELNVKIRGKLDQTDGFSGLNGSGARDYYHNKTPSLFGGRCVSKRHNNGGKHTAASWKDTSTAPQCIVPLFLPGGPGRDCHMPLAIQSPSHFSRLIECQAWPH